MLNGGSDVQIFFDIMGALQEFFFVISHIYLRCLIEIAKYNNKKKGMKVEVKSC